MAVIRPVALLCLAAFLHAPAHAAVLDLERTAVHGGGEDKALKALEAWLKAYRAGNVDVASRADVGKNSIAAKFGVLPKGIVGEITARRELELLLDVVVKIETDDAAALVLAVAAIGLDHGKVNYKSDMLPQVVRAAGEQWLAKFTAQPVLDYIGRVARGSESVDKTYGVGMRAAAVRNLGARKDPAARDLCEQLLRAPDVALRLAAADSLAVLADERSTGPLAGALDAEKNDVAVGALVEALSACLRPYLLRRNQGEEAAATNAEATKAGEKPSGATDKPAGGQTPGTHPDQPAGGPPGEDKPAAGGDSKSEPAGTPAGGADAAAPPADPKVGLLRASDAKPAAPPPPPVKAPSQAAVAAAETAARVLGRTSWRADMQLVKFLEEMHAVTTVPALIAVLQRFKDHPELVQSGVLSTLLMHRAREALTSLTSAAFPAEAPEKWAEFWQQQQQLLLAAARPVAARPVDKNTVSGFFGIPVQGNRVLFIIDLSGSMEFAMRPKPGDVENNVPVGISRLDFAKGQLHRVIDGLSEISRINFITFNGNDHAQVWQKEPLEASRKTKELANAYVDKLSAVYKPPHEREGGTNLWAGLEEGLKVRTLVYGDHDDQTVDEIFLVSDGAPSVGDIVDPLEIVRLVAETNRFARMRINTIFITSPNDKDPRNLSLSPSELMRRLAEQNGGQFVEFKS